MFIRQSFKTVNGKKYSQHHLIRSVRTEKGPRQRLILNMGSLNLPKEYWKDLADTIESILFNNIPKSLLPPNEEIEVLASHFVSMINENNLNKSTDNIEEKTDFEIVDVNSIIHTRSTTIGSEHIVNSEINRYRLNDTLQECGFTQKEKNTQSSS